MSAISRACTSRSGISSEKNITPRPCSAIPRARLSAATDFPMEVRPPMNHTSS
jgi:hypothetical protein